MGDSSGSSLPDGPASKSTNTSQGDEISPDNLRVIRIVQFNIFMYSTCFWIQQSCFPYLSKKLGVDNVMYGYLQTMFAVSQLAGGPLFGRFGDRYGAKKAMMLAFSSGVLSYGTLYLSTNIPLLFLSRSFSFLLAGMQGSQMVITDLTPHKHRSDYLGKCGLIYGLGMVTGPFIGGQITRNFGEESSALVAAAGSLFSTVCMYLYIPDYIKHVEGDKSVFNIADMLRVLSYGPALFYMIIKITVGLPIGVLQSMFSLVAMDTFKLPADYNGMVMSYIGVVTMLVQGVVVGIVTKRFSESAVMKFGIISATVAYIILSQVTTIYQFLIGVFPLVVGMTLMQTIITTALTLAVPPQDTGTILGLGMATNSLIRTGSPTLGGYLIEFGGFSAIGYFGTIVCSITSVVLLSRSNPKTQTQKND